MTTFPAFATNFEFHPRDGGAARHLEPLIKSLDRLDFTYHVNDPTVNQGQMGSDFDKQLERALLTCGATELNLSLPDGVPQELDFAFSFDGCNVAVEIEKANREKILRDILKSHIYLKAGAHFALVVLPRNYAHKYGMWDLFRFGVERYNECLTYGFGLPDTLGRIALLGFDQCDSAQNCLMTTTIREEMRKMAAASIKGI